MILKQNFSGFRTDFKSLAKPCLPFTLSLTFQDAETADPILRLTFPGCLYLPLEDGRDGRLGRFKMPTCYGRGRGRSAVAAFKMEPDDFTEQLERELRRVREVREWTMAIKKMLGRDPGELQEKLRQNVSRL